MGDSAISMQNPQLPEIVWKGFWACGLWTNLSIELSGAVANTENIVYGGPIPTTLFGIIDSWWLVIQTATAWEIEPTEDTSSASWFVGKPDAARFVVMAVDFWYNEVHNFFLESL